MRRIDQGWLSGAVSIPSPNADQRPEGAEITLLVVHNISLPPGEFGTGDVARFFTNCLDSDCHPFYATIADLKVSSHLLIDRQGQVTQFVPFHERAWHAGVSCFCGQERCNDFSIGVELEGTDSLPYTDRQYAVLAEIAQTLMQAYPGITRERIVGHSDIAPERKTDPGDAFDWVKLRALIG